MKGSLENISMGMGIDLESLGPIANEVQYLGTTILIFICFRLLVVVITVVVCISTKNTAISTDSVAGRADVRHVDKLACVTNARIY